MKTAIERPQPTKQRTAAPPPEVRFNPRARFIRVLTFFLRVVAHIYIYDILLWRFGLLRWYITQSAPRRWARLARKFRGLAIELGGVHIKLGQFLSARADIIPDAVRYELRGLQDEVPAAPSAHVLERVTADLGASPHELFLSFDDEAVAAASLGQVHFAVLPDGREVAVKVQRPHIEEIVEIDLSALLWVLRLIKDYRPIRRRADVISLYNEFARVLKQELDYVTEARHADLFRTNFADVPGVYVPEPIFEMTTRHVMVMERIYGFKLNDFAALDAAGVSRRELSERLNHTYLKQFFLDGFFHADPHPGNLFVRIDQPPDVIEVRTNGVAPISSKAFHYSTASVWGEQEDPNGPETHRGTPFTLVFIDFGMVGNLPRTTMDHLRHGVIGLATNDAERIVEAMERANMLLPTADRGPVIQAVQVMLRFSYDRTVRELNNMDIEAIFDETQDLVYDLPFQLPQDLLYLGRAMSMVSGLATEIEPDINLFDALRPFAQEMIDRENRRNGGWLNMAQNEALDLGQTVINLPRQLEAYLRNSNLHDGQVRADVARIERGIRRVERSNDRLSGSIVAASLFLGGVHLRSQGHTKEARNVWMLAGAAAAWTFWSRNRSNDRR